MICNHRTQLGLHLFTVAGKPSPSCCHSVVQLLTAMEAAYDDEASEWWFVRTDAEIAGPLPRAQMQERWAAGTVGLGTWVHWKPICYTTPELSDVKDDDFSKLSEMCVDGKPPFMEQKLGTSLEACLARAARAAHPSDPRRGLVVVAGLALAANRHPVHARG